MNSSKNTVAFSPFRGVIAPMITPLLDGDRLDVKGLSNLIEHILRGGVHGLFLLGTTGEGCCLSDRLRRELIERACKQINDRVPVLVGVTDTSLVDSIDLARHAAHCGAHAVAVATPYYLPLEQAELIRYVNLIAAEQPLPIMLYNIPFLTKISYSVETVRHLADDPRVIGIKDSSGDIDYLYALQRAIGERADWSLLVGSERLGAQTMQRGIHGCVAGGANVHPSLLVKIFEAATARDTDRLHPLQEQLEVLGKIYQTGPNVPAAIRGIKSSLNLLGICSEKMSEPYLPLTTDQQNYLRGCLQQLGLLHPDQGESNHAPSH